MSIKFVDLFRKACKVRLETFDKNKEKVHIVSIHIPMMIFLVYAGFCCTYRTKVIYVPSYL